MSHIDLMIEIEGEIEQLRAELNGCWLTPGQREQTLWELHSLRQILDNLALC